MNHYYQPSPSSSFDTSPSSSPVIGPVDSSPPSSPCLVPYSLTPPPPPTGFAHPFAASTKAIKGLPRYEKKTDTSPCTPPGTFSRVAGLGRVAASRSLQEDDYLGSGSPGVSPPSHRTSKYLDREARIWEEALERLFDTGIGQIDLSNQDLKTIPSSIADLSRFFNTTESSEQNLFSGRTIARINTEPDIQSARARSFERTQSIKDSGKERHILKLYLMSNVITSLPPELFTVKNLTVLSLRNNRLTVIPPDICRLTSLHELNISNNRLSFLPWQMLDMTIEKLLVHPNPFLPEPAHDQPRSPFKSLRSISRLHSLRQEALSVSVKPMLSPVTHALGPIPPLTELCLRRLLAPSDTSSSHTVLAEYYTLPLSDQWSLPPMVRRTLTDALPGVVRPRRRTSVDTLTREDARAQGTGTSACPHPAHRGRVFVKHAAERFVWVRRVAGVDVGGAVPMRYRGCLRTCLDFLDEQVPAERVVGGRVEDLRRRVVHTEVSDVDAATMVRAVDLSSVSLDMDDFDDF